jgi:hypothetical protein
MPLSPCTPHDRSDSTNIHLFGAGEDPFALAIRSLTQLFVVRFTTALRPKPRTSTYTSTTLRIVLAASATLSPAVDPYLCETAAETAAPPALTTCTVDADKDARMIAAESAARPRYVRSGKGRDDAIGDWDCCGGSVPGRGDGAREPVVGDLLCSRGGSSGLSSEEPPERDGVGEGPRLPVRGGRGGGNLSAIGSSVVGTMDVVVVVALVARLLPLSVPTARWISRSTVAAALLLSFTAPPLTVWMRVRCFRVVGDCRRRSVRDEGGGGGKALEFAPGVDGLVMLPAAWGEGVECAM